MSNMQREQLLSQLMKWWTGNGWNKATLEKKTLNELLRIRARAQGSGWAVTTHRRRA
ncbi:hypothetical protein D3C85_465880 [compost metagenome]